MQGAGVALAESFGAGRVTVDAAAMAPYLVDWFGQDHGAALAVLAPRDVDEVRAMVRRCADLGLGIVPQGGNTGLVLGGQPHDAARHVCLTMRKMNRIRSIDADDYSGVFEAGCILEAAKDAVAAQDLFLPVTIGAQGTAQIGGIISTNAGGLNVLRYGMTRDQILGLEVVLADGTLWNGLSTLRKNNMGPDLKQLFIGAEGTFGIITAASIRLMPRPTARASALIGMDDLEATMRVYHLARRQCSDLLSAFEFLMPPAMAIAQAAQPGAPRLDAPAGVYALVDLAAPGPVDLGALLEGFLETAMGEGLVVDGILAASEAQARAIWDLREAVNTGQTGRGAFLRSDVSVRLSDLAAFVTEACSRIEAALPGGQAVAYGHFGDGNVHLNVLPERGLPEAQARHQLARAKAILNECVDARGGSISAEHGVGRMKRADFAARQSTEARDMLAGLKAMLDPHGMMNPGCQHP